MSPPAGPRRGEDGIDRLVVALDLAAQDMAEIGMAADLAARFGAALEGIFIEDANLFRLAALPVARQIAMGPPTAGSMFDPAQLESDLRALARRAEDAVSIAAKRAGVRWSFRAVRGAVPSAVIAAVASRDLLVLAAPTRARPALGSLGPLLCRAALEAERSFALLSRPAGLQRPLVVLGTDARLAIAALGVASQLLAGGGRTLDIALAAGTVDGIEAAATAWLRERGIEPRIRRVAAATVAQIQQAALSAGNDALILAADLSCLAAGGAESLAAGSPCPVIVVR
ncbi:MAG: hypothetical protein JNL66_13465 [Alphaproteobacteria bacterium]|nr:hypothetical protein [Alphaproteobacteria bacterium]